MAKGQDAQCHTLNSTSRKNLEAIRDLKKDLDDAISRILDNRQSDRILTSLMLIFFLYLILIPILNIPHYFLFNRG